MLRVSRCVCLSVCLLIYTCRYGFFGRQLETEKAFNTKMTELMREVDQNLAKLKIAAPTTKRETAAPVAAVAATPAVEPAPQPASSPAPAPATTSRPTGLPVASAVELTRTASEVPRQPAAASASSATSPSAVALATRQHAQQQVSPKDVANLQARVEAMEDAGVLSAEQAEAMDDLVSDFVRSNSQPVASCCDRGGLTDA
jgi:cytoskeletal protein RodZ